MNTLRQMTFNQFTNIDTEVQRIMFVRNMLNVAREFDRIANEDSDGIYRVLAVAMFTVAEGLTKGLEKDINES